MKKKLMRQASEKTQVKFSLTLVAAYVLFALFAMGFVRLAWEVREQETLRIDQQVLMTVNGWSNNFLDSFMPIATDIGGMVGVIVLTVVFVSMFIYKNEYRRALLIITSVAGATAINLVIKSMFERARPDLWTHLVHEAGYSFPSGHAMASSALGLAIMVALWNSRWRWWGAGFAGCYILFVGFSRLYLGVHYPTDVLAGAITGSSSAWLTFKLNQWLHRKKKNKAAAAL